MHTSWSDHFEVCVHVDSDVGVSVQSVSNPSYRETAVWCCTTLTGPTRLFPIRWRPTLTSWRFEPRAESDQVQVGSNRDQYSQKKTTSGADTPTTQTSDITWRCVSIIWPSRQLCWLSGSDRVPVPFRPAAVTQLLSLQSDANSSAKNHTALRKTSVWHQNWELRTARQLTLTSIYQDKDSSTMSKVANGVLWHGFRQKPHRGDPTTVLARTLTTSCARLNSRHTWLTD